MSYNKNRKKLIRKRWAIVLSSLAAVLLILAISLRNNTSIRPVSADGFNCVEHEPGGKYLYTISYRGKSFIVSKDQGTFYNLDNGEQVPEASNDYTQIIRCIKMYNLAKEGYVGESPAQLIEGKYQEDYKSKSEPKPQAKSTDYQGAFNVAEKAKKDTTETQ